MKDNNQEWDRLPEGFRFFIVKRNSEGVVVLEERAKVGSDEISVTLNLEDYEKYWETF